MKLDEENYAFDGRLSYPKLFVAEGIKNDPNSSKRFGCAILLPKSDKKAVAELEAVLVKLTDDELEGKRPRTKDLFISDGDGEDGDEHSKDCWILSANRQLSQGRPGVVDANKQPILPEDNAVYAGYNCRFVVTFFVPGKWKKICCCLELVQVISKGETIGASAYDPSKLPDVVPGDDTGFGDDSDGEDEDGL